MMVVQASLNMAALFLEGVLEHGGGTWVALKSPI